jgi:hypothetical protein
MFCAVMPASHDEGRGEDFGQPRGHAAVWPVRRQHGAHLRDGKNGVQGSGSAIDNASVVAGNGMLFVQSGYGLMGVPGNLLLAFKPASVARLPEGSESDSGS